MKHALPSRKSLPHEIPSRVKDHSLFFITICCKEREKNQLCKEFIFEEIRHAIEVYSQKSLWYPHLLLLMPDHLHGIISFGSEVSMKACIANFKRSLATKCKISWQRDFFDHRIRNDENHEEKAAYILNNPVRKGLCTTAEEWNWILRLP